MEFGWIDSHCHLTDESYKEDIETVIKEAQENQIVRFLVVATTLKDAKIGLELEQKYPIDLAVGFHPEDVDDITEDDLSLLEEYLKSGKFVALGEIGLDYHWRQDNKEKQKELFIRQIALADKYDLPILIHTRDAAYDTFEIIKNHPNKKHGIMHCFSGSVESAKEYLKLGFYISLAGPVTFKNSMTPKEVAKMVPLDRILIETDCPYMTPTPFRGKRNEPKFVAYTGMEVANQKGISFGDLQKALVENYDRLFEKEYKDR